ncbi:Protein yippee [Hondaea fermentalgiana]|uniref:Protein yippee n=1 Tax=Hondaea fermentalgiana TaxID=2315210 RepID=A0A2R5G5T6_9STRA|nr:Protein yippee [Hondaea fermentalgiana]|eukprot:GBG25138.1 Protein yippee [Hondaea fermentalgiana]
MILLRHELGPGTLYVCAKCGMQLTRVSLLESKNFHGNSGPAILVTNIWNFRAGPKEKKQLITGPHTIQDTFCRGCNTRLGWGYVNALDESQKYKEGKFILELKYVDEVLAKVKIHDRAPTGRFIEEALAAKQKREAGSAGKRKDCSSKRGATQGQNTKDKDADETRKRSKKNHKKKQKKQKEKLEREAKRSAANAQDRAASSQSPRSSTTPLATGAVPPAPSTGS